MNPQISLILYILINASPIFGFVRYHFLIAKYTKCIPKLDITCTSCIHFEKFFFRCVYNQGIMKYAFRACNISPKTGETHFLLFQLLCEGSSTVLPKEGYKKRSTATRNWSNVFKFISEQDFTENQLPNINECSIHGQAVFDILMCWWCSPSWLQSSTLAAPFPPVVALQPLVQPSALLS